MAVSTNMTGPIIATDDRWRVWASDENMADLYFRRATGALPEMESAKAAARRLRSVVRAGDRILDAGCGAGHYLRSLRRAIDVPFSYMGTDATPLFVQTARRAWAGETGVEFELADVFSMPFADEAFDVAFSCNLFLHLPSIDRAITELARVARRHVLIRTLVGDRSFRIQEVRGAGSEEFDERGDPRSFAFYNIYSRAYLDRLLAPLPRVAGYQITPDREFDAAALSAEADVLPGSHDNTTRTVDGCQVNGYVLLPWQFISIDLAS